MLEKKEIYRSNNGTYVNLEDISEMGDTEQPLVQEFYIYIKGNIYQRICLNQTNIINHNNYLSENSKIKNLNEIFTIDIDGANYNFYFDSYDLKYIEDKNYLLDWLNNNLIKMVENFLELSNAN